VHLCAGKSCVRASAFPVRVLCLCASVCVFARCSASSVVCSGHAGSLFYEVIDANTFAEWGVDMVKYDNCGEYVLVCLVRVCEADGPAARRRRRGPGAPGRGPHTHNPTVSCVAVCLMFTLPPSCVCGLAYVCMGACVPAAVRGPTRYSYGVSRFVAFADAVAATGRPMVISTEPFLLTPSNMFASFAHMWRTGDDINADWNTIMNRADMNGGWACCCEVGLAGHTTPPLPTSPRPSQAFGPPPRWRGGGCWARGAPTPSVLLRLCLLLFWLWRLRYALAETVAEALTVVVAAFQRDGMPTPAPATLVTRTCCRCRAVPCRALWGLSTCVVRC
jgi:hypothetical protein